MANTKLTALTAASAPDFTEYLYGAQGGNSRKFQLSQFARKANATTSNPGPSDDLNAFWSPGSLWLNTNTAQYWINRTNGAGAAIWDMLDMGDHPGFISGNWYLPYGATASQGTPLIAATISILPMVVRGRVTINQLGAKITTVGGVGSNIQLAIYPHLPSTGRPTGNPLASTASIGANVVTVVNGPLLQGGGTATLEPGMYWMAVNSDNALVVLITHAATQAQASMLVGSPTLGDIIWGNNGLQMGLSLAQAYVSGTWPDVTGSTWVETNTAGTNSAKNALLAFRAA